MIANKNRGWSPYISGAMTGILIILSAWIFGQYFGTASAFIWAVAFLETFFTPARITEVEFFQRFVPKVDWHLMFVIGILIGSLIAAVTSRTFKVKTVPDMWISRFGPSRLKRGLAAFCGGVLLMFGAILAGSCPSGYALGGMVQLAVSGMLFMICFFAGGIVFANMLYGGKKP